MNEIQIFSLHCMLKNISYFNVSGKPLGFTDIKISNVFHHPGKLKYELQSLIIYTGLLKKRDSFYLLQTRKLQNYLAKPIWLF